MQCSQKGVSKQMQYTISCHAENDNHLMNFHGLFSQFLHNQFIYWCFLDNDYATFTQKLPDWQYKNQRYKIEKHMTSFRVISF